MVLDSAFSSFNKLTEETSEEKMGISSFLTDDIK